jgi:hypothetical protein
MLLKTLQDIPSEFVNEREHILSAQGKKPNRLAQNSRLYERAASRVLCELALITG